MYEADRSEIIDRELKKQRLVSIRFYSVEILCCFMPRKKVRRNRSTLVEGARPRTTTHDQVFLALSEAVHVVPPLND